MPTVRVTGQLPAADRRGGATAAADVVPVGADGAIELYNAGASTVTVTVDLDGGYYRYP